MGRPSIPPSLLMRAVLLQLRDYVSDREAARRAAKNLDWKRTSTAAFARHVHRARPNDLIPSSILRTPNVSSWARRAVLPARAG
jgi:hypothetical protein